jgi:hypothetical protein
LAGVFAAGIPAEVFVGALLVVGALLFVDGLLFVVGTLGDVGGSGFTIKAVLGTLIGCATAAAPLIGAADDILTGVADDTLAGAVYVPPTGAADAPLTGNDAGAEAGWPLDAVDAENGNLRIGIVAELGIVAGLVVCCPATAAGCVGAVEPAGATPAAFQSTSFCTSSG